MILKNICYAKRDDEELMLDVYLPEEKTFSVFVYFHGGGLETGSKESSTRFTSYLIDRGVAVVSANYRMYPDAKYPDFVEDAASVVHWVSEHIGEYGKCEGMIVGGSSAGGYLSMMLCFDPRWLEPYGELKVPIVGYFHNAGQPTCHFNVLRERGLSQKRSIIDDSAPLFHIGTSESYPPMHFVVSDQDIECRYEQTMLVLATLRHFGYDESKFGYTLVHGKHCAHNKETDENGDNIFGKMVFEFIKSIDQSIARA